MFEAFTLNGEEVRAEEERLRERVRRLPDAERAAYFRDYNKALKDPDTYASLNWFCMAGLHHFYLGRIARGMVNLLLMIAGLILLVPLTLLGVLLIAIIVLIELPALFRSQVIVAHYNNQLAEHLLTHRHHRGPQ